MELLLDCSLKPILRSCSRSKHWNNYKGLFYVLPDDILMDILSRLPDKPLVRLKCLSKAWYYLISRFCNAARPRPVVGLYFRTRKLLLEKEFVLLNRTAHHPALYYFMGECLTRKTASARRSMFSQYASLSETGDGTGKVFEWEECLSSFALPFVPDPDDLVDCCNGLLLFFDLDSSQYYVSNPLTRQSVLIPRPRWIQQQFLNAALVFDPSKSTSYRVVRYDWDVRDTTLFLDIYSSCNSGWSRLSVRLDPCARKRSWHRSSTYFNGALYRLSFLWQLVEIDLEKVTVRATELPLTFSQSKGLLGCLGVLMGQLCYANEDTNLLLIWSFEKEGSHDMGRWILKHSISIYDLTRGLVLFREYGRPDTKWVGPVAFDPSSNTVFLGTPLVILSYNLDSNQLEELIRVEEDIILPGCYCPALTYVRYLAPFNREGKICPERFSLEK